MHYNSKQHAFNIPNIDFDLGSIFSGCNKRLPFDWHAPLGYSIAFLLQVIEIFCTCYAASPITCFVVGLCLYVVAFVRDITSDLHALNAVINSTDSNQVEVKKRFCDIIKLYTDVKQLSEIESIVRASSA